MQKITRSQFDLLKGCGFDSSCAHSDQNMRGRHIVMMKKNEGIRIVLLEENTGGFYLVEEDANLRYSIAFLESC